MTKYQPSCESSTERKEREVLIAKWVCHKFNQRYPDEDSCVRELCKRFLVDGQTVCRKCGSKKTRKIDERSFICLSCHKKGWFTAGTPFDGLKKVRPWFLAQWLHEQGINVNGRQLADLAMVSKSTGAYIIKKVTLLKDKKIGETNTKKIPSITASTNLIQHSEYKPEQNKDQHNDQPMDLDQPFPGTEPLNLQSEKETKLYSALTETPQDFDTLLAKLGFDVHSMASILTILELNGLVTRLAGDRYIKNEKPRTSRHRTKKTIASASKKNRRVPTLGSMLDSLKSKLHVISSKILRKIFQISDACVICGTARETLQRQRCIM